MILLLIGLLVCSRLPAQNIVIQRNLVYRTVEGQSLTLDVSRPEEAAGALPVIIALHGWTTADRDRLRPVAEGLAAAGYAVATVHCRPAPRWIFPAQLEDARAAAAWIRENAETLRVDARNCFLLGYSAGGQLAGLLGTREETSGEFAGVMLLAAPTDLTAPPPNLQAKIAMRMYLGAEREEKPELYAAASPITHVSAADPPFLVIAGEKDDYLPPAQATRMTAALKAKAVPAHLLLLPEAGHEPPSLTSPEGVAMLRAMQAFLAGPRAKNTASGK
ncbi:MAG: alpha/beta hydrolase fold domain-containing protein [Armatimonadota bacterium]